MTTPPLFEPDGRSIPYAEEGEGPVRVVLLPARGMGISSLGTLAHVLEEEGFHLLRIGVRENATDDVTLHDLAQDVVDVMNHVGMGSGWIGGHEFGGALARTVALDHRDHTEGVVLIGVETPEPFVGDAARALHAVYADDPDAGLVDAGRILGGGADPSLAHAVLTRHRLPAAATVQTAALSATPVEEWTTLAPSLAILVVQGSADVVSIPADAEKLQASAPERVSLTVVDGAGHLGVLTHAGEVGFAIEDYLAWD